MKLQALCGQTLLRGADSVEPHSLLKSSRSSSAILDVLESELEKYEGQLLELSSYSDELTAKYNEKIEFQECLEKGRNFFETEASAVLSEFDAGSLVDSTHATPITAEDGMQPLCS